MIKRISMLLAQKIVLENNEKDNEDIYAYGLEIIINSLISIISVLAIGILQHNFWYTVIYLTTYCSIRLYAGGYHEYSNAIVHAFQGFRAPFSGKIVHIFPEQSAAFN